MQTTWAAVFADVAAAEFDTAAAFWTAVSGGELGSPSGDEHEFVPIVRPDEDPYVYLQRTGRAPGEAGWHFDVFVTDQAEAVTEAVELGAQVRHDGGGFTALSTPAGQAFCLVKPSSAHGSHPPVPAVWPDGHQSLIDQICFDIPAEDFRDEVQFWAALTGWERRASDHKEFERLVRPAGQPLRILLQRMDDPEPIRAHVDLSCDDNAAEVARHERLGAQVVRRTEGWTTLRDPLGSLYCVTRRVPGR